MRRGVPMHEDKVMNYDERIVRRIRLALCDSIPVQRATHDQLLSAYACWCIEGSFDWDYFPRLLNTTTRHLVWERLGYTDARRVA